MSIPKREEIARLYCEEELSTVAIARTYNVTPGAVNYWLRKYGIKRRPTGCQAKDLTGWTYGELTVLGRDDSYPKLRWRVQCSCGKELSLRTYDVKRRKHCGCKNRGDNHHLSKQVGQITGNYFSKIRTNAKRRNIDFDLTMEQLSSLYEKQGGLCAMTGRELKLPEFGGDTYTASVDRKDPSAAYTIQNVQFVHRDVNYAKGSLTQSEFMKLCEEVVAHA